MTDAAAGESQLGGCGEQLVADGNDGGGLDRFFEALAPGLAPPGDKCAVAELSRIEGGGERFVLVHGQLLDQERVDGRQNGCRGQLILGQVTRQQRSAVRSLILMVGGVAHADHRTP